MDMLTRLAEALRCLPGIGPKSAQRMIYHLLKHQRQRGLHLAACLEEALSQIQHCQRCRNYTEHELCIYCRNSQRDTATLCVVESPADILAIEQSHSYQGTYFVLMGKISPLDGLGPEDIGLSQLKELIIKEQTKEVILALSPSIEGHTTIHFIQQLLQEMPVHITKLAYGIPSGSELEFLDGNTIGNALRNRAVIHVE
ncbi:MAG: recombination protein RecR [Legionella sp.]|nr:recombination protein RecR [Legionella sp.]